MSVKSCYTLPVRGTSTLCLVSRWAVICALALTPPATLFKTDASY